MTQSGTIFVINPNSSETVTQGIDRALEPARRNTGHPIACLTLAKGPPGIETQRHIDLVVPPLLDLCARREAEAAAFVIACFSDPGLAALREQSRKPVFGIAESAVLTALTLGQRFGVLSILRASVSRHLRAFAAMGVSGRLAADLPLNLGVAELADEAITMERLISTGRQLRDTHMADVLILGCAGMAGYRRALEVELGVPVVDPCQAATAMAIGRLSFDPNDKI